jgi:ADP-ribose pyrophosphatase
MLSSTVVYENRWITVRHETTCRPDGTEGAYGIVDKADFALVIPEHDGGFFLVEQFRYPLRGSFLGVPNGIRA